ncbi:MAG: hypothetical protein ACD_19C00425G0005 [uncultured bacterium]|nr:MAG: hypothetical protein ACD_19C00425G0005 [uncultured bacterium]
MTKNKNFSIKKVISIVFLIVTLIVAVSLTNNTVKKFIFGSEASGTCDDLGSPSARNACKREDRNIIEKYKTNYNLPQYIPYREHDRWNSFNRIRRSFKNKEEEE